MLDIWISDVCAVWWLCGAGSGPSLPVTGVHAISAVSARAQLCVYERIRGTRSLWSCLLYTDERWVSNITDLQLFSTSAALVVTSDPDNCSVSVAATDQCCISSNCNATPIAPEIRPHMIMLDAERAIAPTV